MFWEVSSFISAWEASLHYWGDFLTFNSVRDRKHENGWWWYKIFGSDSKLYPILNWIQTEFDIKIFESFIFKITHPWCFYWCHFELRSYLHFTTSICSFKSLIPTDTPKLMRLTTFQHCFTIYSRIYKKVHTLTLHIFHFLPTSPCQNQSCAMHISKGNIFHIYSPFGNRNINLHIEGAGLPVIKYRRDHWILNVEKQYWSGVFRFIHHLFME